MLRERTLWTMVRQCHVDGVFPSDASSSSPAGCVVQPCVYIYWPAAQTAAEKLVSDLPGIFWRGCIWSLPPLWNIPLASCSWPKTGQTYLWQDKHFFLKSLFLAVPIPLVFFFFFFPKCHHLNVQNIKNCHVSDCKSHVLHEKVLLFISKKTKKKQKKPKSIQIILGLS